MAATKFHKVTSLPGSLDADAFYYVVNGSYAEGYVTNSAGVAKSIGNSTMINSLADARISLALADLNTVEIVNTIALRNALTATLTRNAMILVLDATADTSVTAGAALYVYRESDTSTTKIAEYEGLDVVVTWASITGKPTSSPTLIDDAVTKRHSHSNIAVLDQLADTSGNLTYGGSPVTSSWTTLSW
jgi:hypothetical protein